MVSIFDLAARVFERSESAHNYLRRFYFRGKGRIVQRLRDQKGYVAAPCDGVVFRLNLEEHFEKAIYFNLYERKDWAAIRPLIPVGGTCIDVGANIGFYALRFARIVGPFGHVYAFEPDPVAFSRLVMHRESNGFDGVLECYRTALSNEQGEATLYRFLPNAGWSSLHRFADLDTCAEVVPTQTLDDFLEKRRIDQVDVLKLDAEAHEPEILAGAARSLARRTYNYILMEFNGPELRERGKSIADSWTPLQASGYRPCPSFARTLEKLTDKDIRNILFQRS